MKTFKRWILKKENLDNSDFLWIKPNCYRVDRHVKTNDWTVSSGQNFTVVQRCETIITTETDAQEAMLQLKYHDQLILLRIIHVETNGQVLDEYGALY